MIDIHTHVLPGIDDGARDWDESLSLLRMAESEGIKTVLATPHYSVRRPLSADRVLPLLAELKERSSAAGIRCGLHAGHEVMYFDGIGERLEAGDILCLGSSRLVLVEFPPDVPFVHLSRAFRHISECGYEGVLAHAERYGALRAAGVQGAETLLAQGVRLQLSTGAVTQPPWQAEGRFARRILRAGLVSFLGTDMHRPGGREPRAQAALAWLKRRGVEFPPETVQRQCLGI